MSTFKTLVKTTLTPIAICLTLAIAAPAIANKGHHQQHNSMRQILSELSLSDTQQQDIRQIAKQARDDRGLFSTDVKSLKTELRGLVQSTEWDPAAVEFTIGQRQTLIQEKVLQRANNKNQVWNLLTSAQQVEFVAHFNGLKAGQKIRKVEREEMKAEGKRKGRPRGQKIEHLDLTEEQLAAVKVIKTVAESSAEETKDKLKSFKRAERLLVQSTNFNVEAWQTLSNEYKADFLAIAVLRAKTKHDIWNLLTPEQQLKAQKQNKHKGKNHKHKQTKTV
jgi:Spy/CpxP family protein refolding chaperone